MKKYELTNNNLKYGYNVVYRIIALRDFGNVKAGDLGGYVEGEHNLSHDGNCWIYDDAIITGNVSLSGSVSVMDNVISRWRC